MDQRIWMMGGALFANSSSKGSRVSMGEEVVAQLATDPLSVDLTRLWSEAETYQTMRCVSARSTAAAVTCQNRKLLLVSQSQRRSGGQV